MAFRIATDYLLKNVSTMGVSDLWTTSGFQPGLDDTLDADSVSTSADDTSVFKSPIMQCAWDHVKEVWLL